MPRFKNRQLQWTDIMERFVDRSSQLHVREALAYIGALRDQGRRFWDADSECLLKWQEYCTPLWKFINDLSRRRDLENQKLETAMREFIHEFEHSTGGMYVLIYGLVGNADGYERIEEIFVWFDLVFRASTYALVSSWIPEMQDTVSLTTHINLTTSKTKQEGTRTEMKIPKGYQKMTKRK